MVRIDFAGELQGNETGSASLVQLLENAEKILKDRQSKQNLSSEEIKASLCLYHQLQDILSLSTRTGDSTAVPSSPKQTRQDFHETSVAPKKRKSFEFKTSLKKKSSVRSVTEKTETRNRFGGASTEFFSERMFTNFY